MTREPTADQSAVLVRPAPRIRVVKASPGSGKTWLVAEVIEQELRDWNKPGSGIAALSFTRVGGEEIRKAVGNDLDHPHFVGTIDAFLFRFVIRPFFKVCMSLAVEPRLLPEDLGARHWTRTGTVEEWVEVPGKKSVKKGDVSIFECQYVGVKGDVEKTPILQQMGQRGQAGRILSDALAERVRKKKTEVFNSMGLLTHSDAALLASKMLTHQKHGAKIRAEIARRFPFVVVDELQDTGYFLGKCILAIFEESSVRAVAVGDPDQAIFEFTGARPELFDSFSDFPGAVVCPLSTTRRCSPKVTRAAKFLKETTGDFIGCETSLGRAVLLSYSDMVADVGRLVSHLAKTLPTAPIVVTRGNETARLLSGKAPAKSAPNLFCPALTHMHRAVVALRQGRSGAALGGAQSALANALFEGDTPDDANLIARGIDPVHWKRLATDCVLAASACSIAQTFLDWQIEVANSILFRAKSFIPPFDLAAAGKRLKPQKREGHDQQASQFLPSSSDQVQMSAQTVHAVKGETHEATVFVCKGPSQGVSCPSDVWWSEDEVHKEEKRIAYVAMTRPRGDLFVCVSKKCFDSLAKNRKDFFDSFEAMSIADFIDGKKLPASPSSSSAPSQ